MIRLFAVGVSIGRKDGEYLADVPEQTKCDGVPRITTIWNASSMPSTAARASNPISIALHHEVLALRRFAIRGITVSMSTGRKDSDYLNGVPELLLLRLLARQPMYGYELVQGIRLASGDVLEFGEGCVYPILHRLEADGQVRGSREAVGGRTRVVYSLTPAGRRRLTAATERWEKVAAAVAQVLRGGDDAEPSLA